MKKIVAFLLLVPFLVSADEVLTRNERVIALTILGEARGEGKAGMFAVGCVVQRRSWERKITAAQVCLEESQFSIWNGKKERDLWHLWDSKHVMYARHLARCINSEDTILMDVTNGANHYCNINVNPYWAKGKKPVIIIGKHKFYKL